MAWCPPIRMDGGTQSNGLQSHYSLLPFSFNPKSCIMQNKRFILILATAALLSIPFIAMQFTAEVDWDLADFLIMGVLLFGTGTLIEVVLRKVKSIINRLIICGVVLLAFLLIWAELAVGIFGSPIAGS